ncbi:hypothetical protein ACRALDRAFT_2091888, partial [Sodiomyces alcalophilus JCM 7366]|uniref:uncharacterized protein n=1 Tax=Sodiomyces alcalophilus JCM 7366 TaxID=591952 RepID=UPI0039B67E82
MTEKPQLPHQLSSTQIAIPSQKLPIASTATVSQTDDSRNGDAPADEEPYTIKCICNFSDDDGNTIYCETCDTWQHIECYYPDSREEALREDFAHSCAECKPRHLDIQKAIERTRRLRDGAAARQEASDKKSKRSSSKTSHKKKTKPTDLHLNGHTGHQENGRQGNASDHLHPAKRSKSSHRSSHSTSSLTNKRSPSHGNGRSHGHPPSPASTPPELPNDFEIHGYSERFLTLYGHEPDPDPRKTPTNSFSSLATSNAMSLWLRDPERMKQETGHSFSDVFQKLPADIDTRKRELVVQEKQLSPTPNVVIRWKYLATPLAIEKDVPLMELHGQIGFQKDYCADPESMWEELSTPLPFVFFHPMLPLCIDTRNEKSPGRYVRRSCKPNAVLDTYLSNTSEYHFWLVSDRYIGANEQITLPWDFRLPNSQKARMLHLIGLSDDEGTNRDEPDMDETEYQRISSWLHRVLSESGGCACDLGNNCAFARFHRQYRGRTQPRPQAAKKKARKPKVQTISPTSTGYASNSRAASESHVDDVDHDGRSVSEKSKPPSRDRTPFRQGSLDQPEILTEPTDRDKRKVQMVEDTFRRMEQQPRKKKRVSEGSSTKSKSKSTATTTGPGANGPSRYVDAGTSRRESRSPASAHSAQGQNASKSSTSGSGSVASQSRLGSTAPRPQYCDASVQTDPVVGEWYSSLPRPPKPRRRVISLSQRLLNNRHRLQCDEEERRRRHVSLAAQPTPVSTMDIDGSPEGRSEANVPAPEKAPQVPKSPASSESRDVPMTDAPSMSPIVSPTSSKPPAPGAAVVNGASNPEEAKTPDLRVEKPTLPTLSTSTLADVTTPQSGSASLIPSPVSSNNPSGQLAPASVNGIAQPSPVKKKLSLSDYTKSRMNKAAAAAA